LILDTEGLKIIIIKELKERKLRQGRCIVALALSAKVAAVSLILYRIKCASDTTVKESVVKTGRRSSFGSGSTPEINDF